MQMAHYVVCNQQLHNIPLIMASFNATLFTPDTCEVSPRPCVENEESVINLNLTPTIPITLKPHGWPISFPYQVDLDTACRMYQVDLDTACRMQCEEMQSYGPVRQQSWVRVIAVCCCSTCGLPDPLELWSGDVHFNIVGISIIQCSVQGRRLRTFLP